MMSATVIPPPGASQLARSDPWKRLQDYHAALGFYLQLVERGFLSDIVFGDNSAADVSLLRNLVESRGLAGRVEFISVSDLNYPTRYGRGYGEFRLIDLLMKRSQKVAALAEDGVVWKVTGRYIVRNMPALMASRPENSQLYCHCRDIPLRWVEMFTMAFTRAGYASVLEGCYEQLREDRYKRSAEVSFRDLVDSSRQRARIVRRFRVIPRLEGFRGVDNRPYQDSRAKYVARTAGNWVAPWLWF